MSTTQTKRPYARALAEAQAFRDLFPADSYSRWEFAGSLRRGRPDVSDIEHVVIPRFADIPDGADLFARPVSTNLVMHTLDRLVKDGAVTKHPYGATGFRWGQKYRGADFHGFNNEVFCAEADGSNFGPTFAIRTGPAEFSQRLVSGLLRNGRRNKDGRVWACDPCDACRGITYPADVKCGRCDGTRLLCVEPIAVPTEEAYFELAGVAWCEPGRRG